MRAPLDALNDRFDIVIIGAGVHGAFAALEAARRGLRVALIDRGDFGAGTSANSLRIAHGGLRYLGRGDARRMRESIRERAALMHLVPHLVRPLPCALPLRRQAARPFVLAALRINDLAVATFGRGPALPRGRTIGAGEMALLAEEPWWGGAPAAAVWYDALIDSPERLIIMVLREAAARGAVLRNYTRATVLLRGADGRVRAVAAEAEDGSAELRARVVLDATGPAGAQLVGVPSPCSWADGWNVVLSRPAQRSAIAIPFPLESRALFAVPWRDRMVLGTGYAPASGDSEGPRAATGGLLRERTLSLLQAVNLSLPALALDEGDVALVHSGVLPMRSAGATGVRLLDQPMILDQGTRGGPEGVVTMIGVKWTTARAVADRAVARCQRIAGISPPATPTLPAPLCSSGMDTHGQPVHGDHLDSLYGPLAAEVRRVAAADPRLGQPLDEAEGPITRAHLTGAQVVHAMRYEGAVHLEDVLMRRATTAAGGWPGASVVRAAARIMGEEAGWSEDRVEHEVESVAIRFGRTP